MASGQPSSDSENKTESEDQTSKLQKEFRSDSLKAKTLPSLELFWDGKEHDESTDIKTASIATHQTPLDPRRVLITGLTSSVTDDLLKIFLEEGCGIKITDIEKGADKEAVVVVLKSNANLECIQEYCLEHSCNGTFLEANFVEASDTVKITGFKPTTTKDTFERYLKTTVGVAKIRLTNVDTGCFVQFTNSKGAELFLNTRRSKLDGQRLTVQMYHLFLGDGQHAIPCCKLILADPDVISYLAKSDQLRKEIDRQSTRCFGLAEWGADSNRVFWLRIHCNIDRDDSWAPSKIAEWTDGCNMMLEEVQRLYHSKIMSVPFEKFDDAEEEIQQLVATTCQDVEITLNAETACVHLVGIRQKVVDVANKLKKIIDRFEDFLAMNNYDMTKLFPIRQCYNTLLESTQLRSKEFKIKDRFVEIKGSRDDVNADISFVERMLETAPKRQLTEDTDFVSSALAIMNFKESKQYIKAQLMHHGLHLAIDNDEKGTIILVSKSNSHLEQGVVMLKKMLHTTVIQYDPAIDQTLQTNAYIRTLEEKYKNQVIVNRRNDFKVELTSLDYLHAQIVEKIKNHIANISSVKYCLPLSPGRLTFLIAFGEKQYNCIQNKMDVHLKPLSTMKNETISIEGERQNARIVVRDIRQYTDSLSERRLVETLPGFLRFIKTDKGNDVLSKMQLHLRCVVKVYSKSQINVDSKSKPAFQSVGECRVGGCTFLYEIGELFERTDDVLVVPVTKTLEYTEGIGKDMLKAGGISVSKDLNRKSIKRQSIAEGDIVSTAPGKLSFKSIKHAVLPVYEGSIEQQRLLGSAVLRCLEESSNDGHTSIAFPPLGQGQFKFPIDIIAQTMVQTVKRFLTSSQTSLSKVTICDSTLLEARYFTQVMSEGIANYVRRSDVMTNPARLSQVLPVSTVKGPLLDQTMDVIVTFVPFKGELGNVEIIGKLPKETQHESLELFKCLYPNSVGYGEVATLFLKPTADIKFKAIFVCILPDYKDEEVNAMLILRMTMLRCLQKVQQNGYSSIGFHPAGISEFRYPGDVIADTMIDAFGIYVSMRPHTKVHVLVAIDEEDRELGKVVDSAIKSFDVNSTKCKSKAQAVSNLQEFVQKDYTYITNIQDVTLAVIEGDIVEQTTAVIVNSVYSLELTNGNVSNAILKAAGHVIQGECRGTDAERQFRENGFVITSPGKLLCQCIVHLKAADHVETWKRYVTHFLEEIEHRGFCSVSLPVLGVGARGMKLQTMILMMFQALESYITSDKYKGVLKLVQIVCFDSTMEQEVTEIILKHRNKSRGIHKAADRKNNEHLVTVHVYGDSDETVEKAVDELTNLHIEYRIEKVMPETIESKGAQIHDIELKQGVAVVYDKPRRQLTIHAYDKRSLEEAKASLDIVLKM